MRLNLNLFIDEVIIKANVGSIFAVVSIIDFVKVCPIDGTKAHWTRFAGGEDFVTRKVESIQLLACFTDSCNLCMGCWVVEKSHSIASFSNNFSVPGNNGTEWSTAISYTISREIDCPPHQFFFRHYDWYFIRHYLLVRISVCRCGRILLGVQPHYQLSYG